MFLKVAVLVIIVAWNS